MQGPTSEKPPVGVVFDSDLGNRIGGVLALALLYGLEGRDEARIVSLSVSKSNLKAAAFCEVMARFYAGAYSEDFATLVRIPPVGLSVDGKLPEDTPILTAPLSRRDAGGQPVYHHGIHKLTDTAEVAALIRNRFTAQHDQNCVVVLAGPATNLARVLEVPGVTDLISRKVRFLSVAGGAYPEGEPELSIQTDVPAAQKLFAEWPTPIVASGREVGEALLFPASSIKKHFAWSQYHPVVDAYRAYQPMPYDAPTEQMAAALYAVRPEQGYFRLSEPGRISVLADGRTRFTPSPDGRHRYLTLNPAQKKRILQVYTEIAGARPVPRRRRPPPQEPQ